MKAAVVTLAHGRHDHLANQQRSLAESRTRPSSYVVVAMDDLEIRGRLEGEPHPVVVDVPADPRGLPLARSRNRGAEYAFAGGADMVIMLDVDCLAGPELVAGYVAAVTHDPCVVWSGPVTFLPPPGAAGYPLSSLASLDKPHPARPAPSPGELVRGASPDLFWSLSFALHRDVWRRVGGFCEEYVGYGGEDTDFGQQCVDRGVELGWTGDPRAFHQHHPTSEPPLEHLDDILHNGRIFNRRWGRWPMQGWLHDFERQGWVEQDEDGGWSRAT